MNNMNDSLSFNVNLNNFNGPLEVLLDLAKSQKVNLEEINEQIKSRGFNVELINSKK